MKLHKFIPFLAVLALALPGLVPAAEPDAESIEFFENEIRPLFADNCHKCHGAKKQESGLRLDHISYIVQGGSSGPALVPGDAGASRLFEVLAYTGEVKMPPSGKLSQREISALERWVEMGAPWSGKKAVSTLRHSGDVTEADREFWSFKPLKNPKLPAVENAKWPQSPIDQFILSGLEDAGLGPAPAADRRTLLRRLTYDLTGLPPTPNEVRDFTNDTRPDAYARVVDRLLASPAHGERWGRHWLDVVRYADTAGETADYPVREAYRYRNWVLDAFNSDKPYDLFLRQQIAGDILAGRAPREDYADNVLGTGFIGISRRFGYDSENYHYLTIQDTIDTLGQSFLGLSLGCARCHHHKFDPVSNKDYYALYGIFRSTRYPFPGSEEKKRVRSMTPLVPPEEAAPLREAFEARVAGLERELKALSGTGTAGFVIGSVSDLDGDFELQRHARGGSNGVPVDPWFHTGNSNITLHARSPFTNRYREGFYGVGLPGDAQSHSLYQNFPGRWRPGQDKKLYVNLDFRTVRTKADYDRKGYLAEEKKPDTAWDPASMPGRYRFFLGDGRGDSAAVECALGAENFQIKNGSEFETVRRLEPDLWYNLSLTLDLESRTLSGRVGRPGDFTRFENKRFSDGWSGALDHVLFDPVGEAKEVKPDVQIDNFALETKPITELGDDEVHLIAFRKDLEAKEKSELTDAEKARIEEIKGELTRLYDEGPYPAVYGAAEGYSHDVRVQERGEPDRPGERVERRFLDILGGDPLPEDQRLERSSGRLALADWMARPENPLTARVMVNRIWQRHFGDGLVRTENDFGTRGERPTHPELLDFLAWKFIESGWSMKAIHRLILLSATYQLSAEYDDVAALKDPDVKLRWRFLPRRLDAEALRDSLLEVAGTLDRSVGERHPFPPVLKKQYSQHGPFRGVYPTRRRSVYVMTQRTKAHPYLGLFDGPDPNASTAKRSNSVVPTQSLYLMNSPFVHERSKEFGGRLQRAESSVEAQIRLAYELTLSRVPTAEEARRASEFVATYQKEIPASETNPKEREAESLAALGRTLFWRNEFLYLE